jgi:hypothetical protein
MLIYVQYYVQSFQDSITKSAIRWVRWGQDVD